MDPRIWDVETSTSLIKRIATQKIQVICTPWSWQLALATWKGNLFSKSCFSRGQFHSILPSIIWVVTTSPQQFPNILVIKPRRSSLVHDPPGRARTKLCARCFPATEDCFPLLLAGNTAIWYFQKTMVAIWFTICSENCPKRTCKVMIHSTVYNMYNFI